MKLCIVIVTYNAMQWLSKCLESTKPYSVIVVDNNSSDNTVNFIKTNYPEVTLLEQTKNLGFGAANNIGMSYALKKNADYVFLLNQDAYLGANTIEKLIEVHKDNTEYGIISPIHLNGNASGLDKNFSAYMLQSKRNQFYSDYVLGNKKKEVYAVPFVNAAGWLLSKELLQTVGGFDPIFFHYGEDDNYCQRVLFHGFKIGVIPDSFLLHDRLNRPDKVIEAFSDDLLEKKERTFKIIQGNINKKANFKTPRKEVKKNLIPSLLQLKFKNAQYYLKELKLIEEVEKVIVKSRSINIKKGPHYLN